MFVKTHNGHGGHSGCVMILNRGDTENVHCVDSYGVCKIPIKEFNTNFEPITFKCPHCNATIHQAERVECPECHAVYRAIDEESIIAIKGNIFGRLDMNIYVINSIHWLEIKAGNEKEISHNP